MGRDIHLNIISKVGSVIDREIYDGRDSEWFDNMTGKGDYDLLNIQYGCPLNLTDKAILSDKASGYCFDFCYIQIGDFLDWASQYQPWKNAGWVTTYEAWAIKNKGYIPDCPKIRLDETDIVEDMKFIEYENPYDSSLWLFNYLIEHSFDRLDYLFYYFDN